MSAAPDDATVVAVDVGGTTIKAARVDATGAEQAQLQMRTLRGEAAVRQVAWIVRTLAVPGTRAVGLAVPGLVDGPAATVRYASNLGWRDVPLGEAVSAASGLPVVLERDVRAAGRAEAAVGRGQDVASLLMVTLGTGVGSATVLGGEPLGGETGAAGELGHVTVVPDGEPCACGQRGCLEVYASASGIARRYREQGGDEGADAARIALAVPSDPLAASVWDDAVHALGLALTSTTLLVDPGVIVLGGGLAGAGTALSGPVQAAMQRNLAWREAPPVQVSALGPLAGRIGAALSAWTMAEQGAWA